MTDVNQVPVSTEQPVEGAVVTEVVTPVPGEKTDSALLLKSLQKEREEKRLLKEQLEALKNAPQQTEEVFSDEGKLLLDKISLLQAQIEVKEERENLSNLQSQFPALKDKLSEFEAYRTENQGMKLETIAKAFLIENDLLETPIRRGLEKSAGGGRVVPQVGMSQADITNLRNTNFRKYSQLVREGKLK